MNFRGHFPEEHKAQKLKIKNLDLMPKNCIDNWQESDYICLLPLHFHVGGSHRPQGNMRGRPALLLFLEYLFCKWKR
jgi:hypothetical protein